MQKKGLFFALFYDLCILLSVKQDDPPDIKKALPGFFVIWRFRLTEVITTSFYLFAPHSTRLCLAFGGARRGYI